MRFGFGPAKTTAFHTDGMKFDALKRELDERIKELNGPEDAVNDQAGGKVLDGSAQIRWTAKNGIYVKKGTWNVKGRDPFGSDVLERGNKFLGARDEIARSINLTFGFALNEEGQLIGDYLVDSLLKERVQNEMGAEDIANLDDAELQRRKQNIFLRLDDLDELQQKVDEIRDRELAQQFDQAIEQGAKWGGVRDQITRSINKRFDFAEYKKQSIGYHLVDELLEHKAANIPNLDEAEKELRKQNFDLRREDLQELQQKIDDFKHHSERLTIPQSIDPLTEILTASVGYLHGRQSNMTVQAGTEALLKSAERDILAQKKRDVSKEDFEANSEKYQEEAKKTARRILHRVGMKTQRVRRGDGNVDETNELEGGLTWRNADHVSFSLHLSGVTDLETMALLQSTTLPGKINTIGNRLFALDKELDNHLPNLPEDWDGLSTIRDQIRKVVIENRGLMLELKKMSYPKDVINPAKRQGLYNRLAANIENMDAVVTQFHDLLQEGDIDKGLPFWSDIEKTVDIAEEICLETLALASAVYPRIRAKSGDRNKPQPNHIELPGLTAWHHAAPNFKGRVGNALDQGLKAPDILFRADSTHQKNYTNAITRYNNRIQRLKNGREWYHKNKNLEEKQKTNVVWQPPKSLVKEDPDTEYRLDLISAFQENEELAGAIRRRQMILGETGDFKRRVGKKDDENIYDQSSSDLLGINRQSIANREKTGAGLINDEMEVLKEQRRALILLLYPNLTRPPVGQAAPVQSAALNAERFIEEEPNQVIIKVSKEDNAGRAAGPAGAPIPRGGDVEDSLSSDTGVSETHVSLVVDSGVNDPLPNGQVLKQELGPNAGVNRNGVLIDSNRDLSNSQVYAAVSEEKGVRVKLEGVEGLYIDCSKLKSMHEEGTYWLNSISSNSFHRVEELQEGEHHISEEVQAALRINQTLLIHVENCIDHDGSDEQARDWRTVSQHLWENFGSFVWMRQRLDDFRKNQKAIQNNENQKVRQYRNQKSQEEQRQEPNRSVISIADSSANSAKTKADMAKKYGEQAEMALNVLDKYIEKTHALAYALSPKDMLIEQNYGVGAFPRSAIDTFDRARMNEGFIGSDGHKIKDYAKESGEDSAERILAEDYLAKLTDISGHRFELDQVQSEQHRQTRFRLLGERLAPDLDMALEKNAKLTVRFRGDKLDNQHDPDAFEAAIVSRLKLDRDNLHKLRLSTLMMMEADRRQMQPEAGVANVM